MIVIGLDSYEMEHVRSVVSFEEFLGAIAGIEGLLISVMSIFFGSYIEFMSKFKMV